LRRWRGGGQRNARDKTGEILGIELGIFAL